MKGKIRLVAILAVVACAIPVSSANAQIFRFRHRWHAEPVYYPEYVVPAPATTVDAMPTPVAKFEHVQVAIFELREAKQDVRDLAHYPAEKKEPLLGVIDRAIDQLKKSIEAGGGKAEYRKPDEKVYKNDPNFKHLRHAVRVLNLAKVQLASDTDVPAEAREKGLREIDKAVNDLSAALATVK